MLKSNIERLCQEIKILNDSLKKEIKKYYWEKLLSFLEINKLDDNIKFKNSILKITFTFSKGTKNNNWSILYIHYTKNYNTANYCFSETSEDEIRSDNQDIQKKSRISFGYMNGKYFIKPNFRELKVYKDDNLPRLYNLDYEYELGLFGDDLDILLKKYSDNYNIPEWMAVSFLTQIRKQKKMPIDIIKYFVDYDK